MEANGPLCNLPQQPASATANRPAVPLRAAWDRDWLRALLLVAAILMAYQPVWHAGFIWDDNNYVTANPLLTAPGGLRRIWFSLDAPSQYFPLTYTIFYLERRLWGLNPTGYHWVNLLLHAANALLVWRVLTRLRVPGAWLAAAVFALHPVNVESVAWITERKNVLMGFFFLLTLWAWIKFIEGPGQRSWRFYVLALVLYALALSAKTTACTLPAALLLILWLRKMPLNWRRLAQVAPFMALAIGMGLVTVWWERYHQGTQGKLFAIGPVERVLIASRALWFYAGKLLWPANLTFSYPRWTVSASAPSAYGWVLATAALGGAIWRARRWTGRSVEVAAAYFAVTLSPVLGFIMLYTFRYSFVADHYQYLACIGLIALAAAGLTRALESVESKVQNLKSASPRPPHPMGKGGGFVYATFCGALVVALGALAWRQARMYTDIETLWRTTIARNPTGWMAHNNWGLVLLSQGKLEAALEQFQTALQSGQADAFEYSNLGVVLYRQGKIEDAIAQFRTALRIDPAYPEAHCGLGVILDAQGNADEALTHYRAAIKAKPSFAEAYYNISTLLRKRGDVHQATWYAAEAVRFGWTLAETHYNLAGLLYSLGKNVDAVAEYRNAVRLKPGYAAAHRDLAQVLCAQGKFDEGVREFQSALQLDPGSTDTRGFLANALVDLGRTNEATAVFTDALKLKPADAQTHSQYADLLFTLGQTDAAARQFQAALRYAPGDAETHRRYGFLLASSGHPEEAIEQFREAIRLQPGAEAHYNLATALLQEGQAGQAVAEYRESLRLQPDSPATLNDLAWVLAANASDALRNGAEAVTLAERACQLTQFREPLLLGTLAAAYAEAGRFDDAVHTAEKASDLAAAVGEKKLADRNRQLIELYRSRQPYREVRR